MSPHAAHDGCPADVVTLPAAHTEHVFEPTTLEYLPATHELHGAYPVLLYWPCTQILLSTHLPLKGFWLTEHATHDFLSALGTLSASHAWHATLSPPTTFTISVVAHELHNACPADVVTLPAAHAEHAVDP